MKQIGRFFRKIFLFNLPASDRIAAYAFGISLFAFVFGFFQFYYQLEGQKNAVRPYIAINYLFSRGYEHNGIEISNEGMGMAIIDKYDVYFDKKLVDLQQLFDSASQLGLWQKNDSSRYFTVGSSYPLQQGRQLWVLSTPSVNVIDGNRFHDFINRINVVVAYRSLMDEKFISFRTWDADFAKKYKGYSKLAH